MEQPMKNITKYSEYKYLVYVRVSSGKDSQKESLSNQVDICRYWIEQNNYEWSEEAIFTDADKSGTMFLERTAMQDILRIARSRSIKMVLFKSIHRLARDLKDALEIKEVLVGHGVRVVTIEEGYDSLYEGKNDMKFEMHSMFAAQYPKTLSVSVSAALASKVRRGEHIGKVPFGYDREDHKLIVNKEEAKVVRQIFRWYNDEGLGFKNVTHALNQGLAEGVIPPPKEGGNWQVTTVQSIIKNTIYYGTFILNQYTTVKIDGRNKQIRNPEEKWKVFENQHPKIVSKKDWLKANRRPKINRNTKTTVWNEFRGYMVCGKCHSNMVILQSMRKDKNGKISNWKYFKCSRYRRYGKAGCVNHKPIKYEDFRKFIIEILVDLAKSIPMDYETTFGLSDKKQLNVLKKDAELLREKNKGLVNLLLEKVIDRDEFEENRANYNKELNDIETKIRELNDLEKNEVKVSDLKQAFMSIEETHENLYHAFKVLIKRIVLEPNGEIDIEYNFNVDVL